MVAPEVLKVDEEGSFGSCRPMPCLARPMGCEISRCKLAGAMAGASFVVRAIPELQALQVIRPRETWTALVLAAWEGHGRGFWSRAGRWLYALKPLAAARALPPRSSPLCHYADAPKRACLLDCLPACLPACLPVGLPCGSTRGSGGRPAG